jgi:hypothetical protein
MTDSEIDDAIIAATWPRWGKVARVLCDVKESLGGAIPEGDVGYHLIANRIELLVQAGRLVAQGDLKRWRNSEVRLPEEKSPQS